MVAVALIAGACSSDGSGSAPNAGAAAAPESRAAQLKTVLRLANSTQAAWKLVADEQWGDAAGRIVTGEAQKSQRRTAEFTSSGLDTSYEERVVESGQRPETATLVTVDDTRYARSDEATFVPKSRNTWFTDPDDLWFGERSPSETGPVPTSLLRAVIGTVTAEQIAVLAQTATAEIDEKASTYTLDFEDSPILAYYGGWVADLSIEFTTDADDEVVVATYRGVSSSDDLGLIVVSGEFTPVKYTDPVRAPTESRRLKPTDLEEDPDDPSTVPVGPLSDLDADADNILASFRPGTCVRTEPGKQTVVRLRGLASVPCQPDENVSIVVGPVAIEDPTPQRPSGDGLPLYSAELTTCLGRAAEYLGDRAGTSLPRKLGLAIMFSDMSAFAGGKAIVLCVMEPVPRGGENLRNAWNTGAADAFAQCYDAGTVVPCDQPHNSEDFSLIIAKPDDPLLDVSEPTQHQASGRYRTECRERFEAFTGATERSAIASGALDRIVAFTSEDWPESPFVTCELQTAVATTGTAWQAGPSLDG